MNTAIGLAPLFDRLDACLDNPLIPKAGIFADLSPVLVACALKFGWFAAGDILSEWTCTACDEPHRCDVSRDSDGSYSCLCLNNGTIPLAHQDLQTYLPDWQAFTASLAASIESVPRGIAAHGNGQLLKLGFIASGADSASWTLGLTRRLNDPKVLFDVLEGLKTSFPKGPGLIATMGERPTGATRVEDYTFVDIGEIFRLRDGRLSFERIEATRLLGDDEPLKRKTGRRSATPHVAAIRQTLMAKAAWPTSQDAQILAILKHWKPATMGKTPATSSLPRNIREVEDAERDGRPIV